MCFILAEALLHLLLLSSNVSLNPLTITVSSTRKYVYEYVMLSQFYCVAGFAILWGSPRKTWLEPHPFSFTTTMTSKPHWSAVVDVSWFAWNNCLVDIMASSVTMYIHVVMARGEGLSGYYRWLNKFGEYIWVQSRATMMFDSRTGKPSYVVCMSYIIRWGHHGSRWEWVEHIMCMFVIKNLRCTCTTCHFCLCN